MPMKPGRRRRAPTTELHRHIGFDRAVLEVDARQRHEAVDALGALFHQPHRFAAEELGGVHRDALGDEALGVGERKRLRARAPFAPRAGVSRPAAKRGEQDES